MRKVSVLLDPNLKRHGEWSYTGRFSGAKSFTGKMGQNPVLSITKTNKIF